MLYKFSIYNRVFYQTLKSSIKKYSIEIFLIISNILQFLTKLNTLHVRFNFKCNRFDIILKHINHKLMDGNKKFLLFPGINPIENIYIYNH